MGGQEAAKPVREPTAEDFAAKAALARSEGRESAADLWDRMARMARSRLVEAAKAEQEHALVSETAIGPTDIEGCQEAHGKPAPRL
jgi:hypothetical protein